MPRFLPLLALAFALSPAACTSAPPPASADIYDKPCTSSPPTPWCSDKPFPPPLYPVTPERIRAVTGVIAAACPPPTADDPTPGLSYATRRYTPPGPPRGAVCVMRIPPAHMVQTLLSLLATSSRDTPYRAKLLDELVMLFVLIEYEGYRECRELRVPAQPSESEFARFEDRALSVNQVMKGARAGITKYCAMLAREHPDYTPKAPCWQ